MKKEICDENSRKRKKSLKLSSKLISQQRHIANEKNFVRAKILHSEKFVIREYCM